MKRALSTRAGLAAVLGLMAFLAAPFVGAQNFPDRPVHLVVAYPPGGSGDIIVRAISDKLAAQLGQPVIIDHRPGQSGAEGARSVSRAAPDGYTLLAGQTTEIVINRTLAKELGYDPDGDFAPVAFLVRMPLALIVAANSPYTTVQQLVEAARATGSGFLFASPGPGTPGHLSAELLRDATKTRMTHVPHEGGAPAMKAVMDNRVEFAFQALPTAMPQVAAGKLRILAVSSAQRSPAVPDVPTMAEALGLKDYDVTLWAGVFAPGATPPAVVARLNQDINTVLKLPEVRDALVKSGAQPEPMSTSEFAAFIQFETSKYARLIKNQFCSKLLYGGCFGFEGAIHMAP